jgi:hypothetical protein
MDQPHLPGRGLKAGAVRSWPRPGPDPALGARESAGTGQIGQARPLLRPRTGAGAGNGHLKEGTSHAHLAPRDLPFVLASLWKLCYNPDGGSTRGSQSTLQDRA